MAILDFIQHYWRSQTRHGVHSPFMYALVDECIYASQPRPSVELMQHFRQLKSDQTQVTGFDHGRGGPTTKTIAHYARRSAMPDFQVRLLHRLVHYLQPQNAIELGSNLGKSLAAMAQAFPQGNFTGVEGNESLAKVAQENLHALSIQNAGVKPMTFDAFFDQPEGTYNLAFIDGDHHYAPTLRYFQNLKPMMAAEGVIIFHDIYYSSEMKGAWQSIKKDQDVVITLDLYFFGLAWIGKDQAKQDFRIRYPRLLDLFLILFGLL